MNTERIHGLADFIDMSPYEFSMGGYDKDPYRYGACIASHARLLWPKLSSNSILPWNRGILMDFLGLTLPEYKKLCIRPVDSLGNSVPYNSIDRGRATAALRRFARTGEVAF